MTFDVLSQPLDSSGWAECAATGGFAEFWDRELFGIEIPPWRQNVVRWIEQVYHAGDGSPVIVGDIGCGAALYARHLLAAGIPFEYHGYDHNADVLAAACRRWDFLQHDRVHLHQLEARRTPWPIRDRSLDVVLWDTTLRFCDEPEAALRESLRVARRWVLIARTPLEARTWRESAHYYGMRAASPNWHFEDSFFRSVAQHHRWSFIPCAGDDGLHIVSRDPLPRETTIRPTHNLSRAFHAAFVRERVSRLLDRHAGSWAVYGAGRHTRWLTSILPNELVERFRFLVDDAADPGQMLFAQPILRPKDASLDSVVAMLISSDTIESHLFERARRWLPLRVPVYGLYQELPPGPYDKGLPSIESSSDVLQSFSPAVTSMCRT